jgi:trimethylamine--corrinoid protein Co-methyltransferase
MQTFVQVLSEEECHQVHERSLRILANTGVRVESARVRTILHEAGASVDEGSRIVKIPPTLVEQSLNSAPKKFKLGGRRPNGNISLNEGDCTLLSDGGALYVYDAEKDVRRLATHLDWVNSTLLIDALDEIGLYWWMVQETKQTACLGDFVAYWREVFTYTSKHVQDSTDNPTQSRWWLEILQTVFGDQKTIRHLHPASFLICPLSPLTIEGPFTDAYLETIGWDIPVAIMPMPMMGTTAPGRLISTIVLGNCEVLSFLCLVQAAAPGTPVIYAPALSVADPHSGRLSSGAVEYALLGAAVTEMGRYYGLPVEASSGGTDQHIPGIQAGYERAINWALPTLSWPDILVGPGLLSGSTVFSYEQLLIDIEVFKRCKRLHRGIESDEGKWLEGVIEKVGPGGNFLAQRSTRDGMRSGEWYLNKLGFQDTYETWLASKPDILSEARQKIRTILETHQPIPLDESVVKELKFIEKRARETSHSEEKTPQRC